MNDNRYFKEEKSKCRKKVPRVYTYQNKEISSIQQQIVVDLSQSSYSQPYTLYDDDSIYTFCQSQNKKQAKHFSTQSVSISVENSLDNNPQLKGYQNSFQSSVSIKLSSSNNQPKPNKNRGKSENKKDNNLQRCTSLKSIIDPFREQQDNINSISSISFSNSIKFEPNRNKLSSSVDSINPNKRITRSATQNQNQIISNNLFSGIQQYKDKFSEQSFSSKSSSRMVKNPIIKKNGLEQSNKNQNNNKLNSSTITDNDICQIEKTKYKNKGENNNSQSTEGSQQNYLFGTAGTTQPKQRKNEKKYTKENELDDDDDEYDDRQCLIQTARASNNRINNYNRLVFADENYSKYSEESSNQQMLDETKKPQLKIVKKQNNIFNQKLSPKSDCFNSTIFNIQGHKKADSAQTSVTQCKEQGLRKQSFKIVDSNQNGAKKQLQNKGTFFFFDEDDDLRLSNNLSSLKSQDETHLNIDDKNIWNKNSYQNQDKQNDFLNIQQINQQNIWDQNNLNQSEMLDLNQMFQKRIKNSQQNNQCFGVDNAFTIDYEKLRYTSQNSYKIKHFEFNCFKDKDLCIDQKFQKKIQELTLDDDNQTDDDTLDYYIEVCFKDLLEGIEMQNIIQILIQKSFNENKQQSQDYDENSQSSSCSQSSQCSSKKMDPLWRYFQPPNHTGTIEV